MSFNKYYFDNSKKDVQTALDMLKQQDWEIIELNILKSSIFVIAYNAIEWALTNFLVEMFVEYNNASPKLEDLSKKRKAFVAEYVDIKYKNKKNQDCPVNKTENFFKMLFDLPIDGFDFDSCIKQHHPMKWKNIIEDIKKHKHIKINWNIDERIFEKISDLLDLSFEINLEHEYKIQHLKYKINSLNYKSFHLKNPKPLFVIAEKRNALWHGQEFFSDVWNMQSSMSIEDIEELMISALLYVDLFGKNVSFFIKNKLRRGRNHFIKVLICLLNLISRWSSLIKK